MRKYVIIEIKSNDKGIKNLFQFIWWLTKDALIFLSCIALAILMFTS